MFSDSFRKSFHLLNNVEQYDRDREATDGDITWRRKDMNCTQDNQGGTADTLALFIVKSNTK